ncbi:hypothetical protein SCA6_015867 [Theobroma cacao]
MKRLILTKTKDLAGFNKNMVQASYKAKSDSSSLNLVQVLALSPLTASLLMGPENQEPKHTPNCANLGKNELKSLFKGSMFSGPRDSGARGCSINFHS